jgi:hypothetical protein
MLNAMRISSKFVLMLALLMPAECYAQARCPWINEATVRGVLGGAVALTANVNDQGSGVCRFSLQQGAAVLELRISVNVME